MDTTKNPDAIALGRLGGLKGGNARAQKLSRERRSEIASKAAKARWDKPENQRTIETLSEIVEHPTAIADDKQQKLDTNSKCPKCGTRTLEQDGGDLHCWACGHIIYRVFDKPSEIVATT
jgi:NADH pyrophosphatase NudC (nudix superfamily)